VREYETVEAGFRLHTCTG